MVIGCSEFNYCYCSFDRKSFHGSLFLVSWSSFLQMRRVIVPWCYYLNSYYYGCKCWGCFDFMECRQIVGLFDLWGGQSKIRTGHCCYYCFHRREVTVTIACIIRSIRLTSNSSSIVVRSDVDWQQEKVKHRYFHFDRISARN